MATGQTIIDAIRVDIDDSNKTRIAADATILRYLQEADDMIYPMIVASDVNEGVTVDETSYDISAATRTVTLTSSTVKAIKSAYVPGEGAPLARATWEGLLELWGPNYTYIGTPSNYLLMGNTLYIGPVPDKTYDLGLAYWPIHTLAVGTDMPYNGLLDTFFVWAGRTLCQAKDEYKLDVYAAIETRAQRELMRLFEFRRGAGTRSRNVRWSWPNRLR